MSAAAGASELRLRVASAVVLAAAALGATLAGGWIFAAFWLAAAVAVAAEWVTIAGARPRTALAIVAGLGLAAFAGALRLGFSSPEIATVAAVTAVAVAVVGRSPRDRLWTFAGVVYAGAVVVVPVLLRDRPEGGIAAILWIFAVVWTTDVAAFFVGRALGGPKLWPRVSPKKTWSGFAGGLLAGAAAGTLVVALAARGGVTLPTSVTTLALAALLASAASQAGDLAESAMKRRFGVKDSGRLIPGHGGALDRLDGFAAVALLIGVALAGERFAAQPAGAP